MTLLTVFSQNGGPWGRKPGSSRPSGDGNQNPRRPRPDRGPELEDLLRDAQNRMRGMMGNGGSSNGGSSGGLLGLIAVFVGLGWILSGLYMVQPDEKGVVLRFGKFIEVTEPGLNYHLPWPVEEVYKPQVTRENITEIGFVGSRVGRFSKQVLRNDEVIDLPEESLMLTGDENIVDLDFTVRWKIGDPKDFLFNVEDPISAVKNVAESAMREVMGQHPIDDALGPNKAEIQAEVRMLMQSVSDAYGMGVFITGVELQQVNPPKEVIDAFRDVQAARNDAERSQNEARGYSNDILPRARGQVSQIMEDAKAYKESKIAEAEGNAKRFLSQFSEYKKAKEITRQRLYIEAIEDVLKDRQKVIITGDVGKGLLPYLPLDQKTQRVNGGR